MYTLLFLNQFQEAQAKALVCMTCSAWNAELHGPDMTMSDYVSPLSGGHLWAAPRHMAGQLHGWIVHESITRRVDAFLSAVETSSLSCASRFADRCIG